MKLLQKLEYNTLCKNETYEYIHKCRALKKSIEMDKPRLSQLCLGGFGEEEEKGKF